MTKLMLGNEAVARGVYEIGATVATAYPGTPSTEITEFIAQYDEIYAEWAPNEKVALEVAIGSALSGARSVVSMKHVGLNVAADPLFTVSYTGVNAGLVLCVADDPGMHSSQNEQDTRMIARAALVPVMEPSDSAECKEFVKKAMQLSEADDTPIILRLTTRVAHSQGIVAVDTREDFRLKPYEKRISKYVMTPGNAKIRHTVVEDRMKRLANDMESLGLFTIEEPEGDLDDKASQRIPKIGIITSGIAYQYVKETGIHASILKLHMVNPIPIEAIKRFASKVDTLYVIEELEPVIEEQVRALGLKVKGKELTGRQGELSVRKLKQIFGMEVAQIRQIKNLPIRPAVLCPGCPHRGVYTVLKKLNLTVTGDIGCYTLGSMPPYGAMDTCICMGASIGMSHGMAKARGKVFAKNVVGIIGDSTFIHSGITGLIDIVYNKGVSTIIIADNSITGMTGHQHHPATGFTLKGELTYALDIPKLCKAVGIPNVVTVNAYDMKAVEQALREEIVKEEPSVIITKAPCKLIVKEKYIPYEISSKCIKCGACLKVGCPAICKDEKQIIINHAICAGCGLCATVCPKQAIVRRENQ